MKIRRCLFALLVWFLPVSLELEGRGPALRIVAPANGSVAAMRVDVVVATEGQESDRSDLVVLVHPLATPDYWVQPKGSWAKKGKWKTLVHLGRPGDIDVGKEYEIAAFVGLLSPLAEGDVLKDWPTARARSETVRLKRR
jgi:hypothetical protein